MNDTKHQSKFEGKLDKIQGRDYLRAHSAITWFREDYPVPVGRIDTRLISEKPIMWRAEIWIGEALVASAHAVENAKNADYGKLETNAVRRALAYAGYGTEAAVGDDDFDSETGQSLPRQQPATKTVPAADLNDLTNVEGARAFLNHWRKQGMEDSEIAAALGVKKWSEWTQGRKAADEACAVWNKVNLPDSKRLAS